MRSRRRRCGCKPQLSSDRKGSCVSPLNGSIRIGSLGLGVLPLRNLAENGGLSQLCPDNCVLARPVTSRRVPQRDIRGIPRAHLHKGEVLQRAHGAPSSISPAWLSGSEHQLTANEFCSSTGA